MNEETKELVSDKSKKDKHSIQEVIFDLRKILEVFSSSYYKGIKHSHYEYINEYIMNKENL